LLEQVFYLEEIYLIVKDITVQDILYSAIVPLYFILKDCVLLKKKEFQLPKEIKEQDRHITTSFGESAIVFNNVGINIWNKIDGINTLQNIVTLIQKEYDLDDDRAVMDVSSFICKLNKIGTIELSFKNSDCPVLGYDVNSTS
jgi:Coenzyme PQQ synthesis protein D (PqqD)